MTPRGDTGHGGGAGRGDAPHGGGTDDGDAAGDGAPRDAGRPARGRGAASSARAAGRGARREPGARRARRGEHPATRARARVLEAHAAATPAAAPGRRRIPALAVAAVLVVAVLAGTLTAPGQAVGDWLRDVVEPRREREPARPAPAGLPADGRVLAISSGGVTVVGGGIPRARRARTAVGRGRRAAGSSR